MVRLSRSTPAGGRGEAGQLYEARWRGVTRYELGTSIGCGWGRVVGGRAAVRVASKQTVCAIELVVGDQADVALLGRPAAAAVLPGDDRRGVASRAEHVGI